MKKVLLRGYYGFNNFGDDALLYTLIYKIFGDKDKFDITILSNRKVFDDINYASTKKLNLLKQIISHDILVYGGGSQFQDFGTKESKKGFLFKFIMILLAKLTGSKIIHLGISIGPIKTKFGKLLAKLSLYFSDLIVVRDSKSMDFLEGEIKDKSKFHELPDLTFLMDDPVDSSEKSIKDISLGINVLPFHKTTHVGENIQVNLLYNIRKALINIKKRYPDIQMIFFAFQNDDNISDLEELYKIAPEESIIIPYEGSVDEFNKKIINCSHFISMRFHAAVFAFKNDIPQVNLAYHQKCLQFMDETGYNSQSYIDIRSSAISSEDLEKKIECLLNYPEGFITKNDPFIKKSELKLLYELIEKTIKR